MRGKKAPDFTLTTIDGKMVSLSDYKGRPVLANFWATWCGACKLEMPWFEEFRRKYARRDLRSLVSPKTTLQRMRSTRSPSESMSAIQSSSQTPRSPPPMVALLSDTDRARAEVEVC